MRLGIDFGTTRTVVAFCDRGNYPVVSFADEAGDAVECFPSVVAERKGELRFGFEAERYASDPSWTVLRSFKRMLGDRSPDATVDIGSTRIRMADLLAGFFAALASALRTRSNVAAAALLEPNEPLEAFVAAPANAHSTQRFVCLDAFRRAGFDVLGLLNEPSAAGFEYTHRYRNTLTWKKDHVVVYDIGGGTFDVSLLRMSGPLHEVIATSGINRLGGDDFDDALVALALEKTKVDRASLAPRAVRTLLDQCRQLKEQLNPSSRRVTVDLATSLGAAAPRADVTIDVAEFYERCGPLDRSHDRGDGGRAAKTLAGRGARRNEASHRNRGNLRGRRRKLASVRCARPSRRVRQARAPVSLPFRRGRHRARHCGRRERGVEARRQVLARVRRVPRGARRLRGDVRPDLQPRRAFAGRAERTRNRRAHLPRRPQRRSLPLRRMLRDRPRRPPARRHGPLRGHLLPFDPHLRGGAPSWALSTSAASAPTARSSARRTRSARKGSSK